MDLAQNTLLFLPDICMFSYMCLALISWPFVILDRVGNPHTKSPLFCVDISFAQQQCRHTLYSTHE